jgi:hypothetical protein
MGKQKKKTERKPAPVMTGGDFRAVERSAAKQARGKAKASAPDGVSGYWK